MTLNFHGKRVLVTGSSRGIGKVIAETYLKAGASVVISGRSKSSVQETQREFQKRYTAERILPFVGDLTDDRDIGRCLRFMEAHWVALDVLVANIGSGSSKPGLEANEEDWNVLLKTNLVGAAMAVRTIVPLLKMGRDGNIVFVSSIAGREALAAPLGYSAAKAGIVSLSKNLARTLAGGGLRVNCVAPGNILFPGSVWDRKLKKDSAGVRHYLRQEVAMRRLGTPQEVASAVLFLSSPMASFITGACLVVDGGQTRSY